MIYLLYFLIEDVDECYFDQLFDEYGYLYYNCYRDVNCMNIKGFFYCMCYIGYFGNGVMCFGKYLFVIFFSNLLSVFCFLYYVCQSFDVCSFMFKV